jgi:hypothetical protein
MSAARTRPKVARSVGAGLREWAVGHGRHVQAAVGLLISHEVWLARVEFHAICLHRDPDGGYWIDWTAARQALDGGLFDSASLSERAVLDLAVALAQDHYRLAAMSTGKARMLAAAVAAAAGLPPPRRTQRPHQHDCPCPDGTEIRS